MIKKSFGNTLKEKLEASAKDKLHAFIMADGQVRGAIVHGTRMINEMRGNFELGVLETLVLGHAYLGAALISGSLKGQDQVRIKIDCSGPIKGISVEANALGEVRGFLKNTPIPVQTPTSHTHLSPFFGAGFIEVTKILEDAKHPFTGKIMIEYGSLAKDLANYFLTSEQIPTAFNLSIHFDDRGNVTGAGGIFLQAMPGHDDHTMAEIENAINHIPIIGEKFSQGVDPEALVNMMFDPFTPVILDSHRVEFFCRCTEKRILDYIAMLPLADLEDILANGPFPVETRCHNCNTQYRFSREDIEKQYQKRVK